MHIPMYPMIQRSYAQLQVYAGKLHKKNQVSFPKKNGTITARTPMQHKYMQLLRCNTNAIVVATGPAGCGKTQLATTIGAQKLAIGEISKLVITRPAVSVDEQHGFLPGNLDEKMKPWIRPVFDALEMYYRPSEIDRLLKLKTIELAPLAFMRGRTFTDSFIICDEAQNCTTSQMLMILTRIGPGSKLVVTGDLDQHDRGFSENGLRDFLNRFQRYQDHDDTMNESIFISHVEFDTDDVVRHPAIPYILSMYT